jgi:hypothetical protein
LRNFDLEVAEKRVPAQPVDATLSNQADPQMLTPKESICLADVAKPSQGKVPANLILASAFSFVFNECGS